MRYVSLISAFALLSVAVAQEATVIHVGSVGGMGALAFDPPSVTVASGATVTFLFDGVPGNHTVSQSSFSRPCEPLPGGFDSGFVFVPPGTAITSDFPTFNITISDDSKPIWFYCAQGAGASPPKSAHCLNGMVGAINAPAQGNTFESYAAVASAAASVALPVPALSGVNAFATAAPGPLTGSFSGTTVSSGTAPAQSGGASGSAGASGRASRGAGASGSPAPSGTMDRGECPAGETVPQGLLVFFAAALAVGVVVNLVGLLCLFRIRRGRRRQNTPSLTRKISPFA